MELKQLKQLITRIRTSGNKVDAMIQEAALACILQAEQHGNVQPANDLWQALPNGSRRNALGVYLIQFGKFRINTGKNKDEQRFRFNKQGKTDMEGAQATMWYETRKEKALEREFDFTARLMSVLRAYKKQLNTPEGVELNTDEARVLESLEILAAKLPKKVEA